MVSEMETILIGFFGGVIGGVLVNIISIKYQKWTERKEEEEKYIIEYKRAIKAKLNEIINTWNKEKAQNHMHYKIIQNNFDFYSEQLTSIISNSPDDFYDDIIKELGELSVSLREIKNIRLQSDQYESFNEKCEEIIEKTEVIREKLVLSHKPRPL